MNKFVKPSNLHLTISILIVVTIAFVYGFKPDLWFDVKVLTIDEFNIYKAIMGDLHCFFGIVVYRNYQRVLLASGNNFKLPIHAWFSFRKNYKPYFGWNSVYVIFIRNNR